MLEDGAFMGRLVRLDETINTIIDKHQHPRQINAILAEFSALGALLASLMKYDGLFTLQTQSDGQVPMVVVDVSSDGKIRSFAKFDEKRIKKAQEIRKIEDIEPAPYLLGAGHLAFTVDQGDKAKLYQGVVDIQGKTLSEIALRYFRQSEQIETYIKLFLKAPQEKGEKWQSAGLVLQKIASTGGINNPEINIDEAWGEAVIFADSLKDTEVFDKSLSSIDILTRLYHANKLVISTKKDYHFSCRCSRNKLLDTLSTFKQEDIDAMSEKNKVYVTCNFCSEKYIFDKGEIIKH